MNKNELKEFILTEELMTYLPDYKIRMAIQTLIKSLTQSVQTHILSTSKSFQDREDRLDDLEELKKTLNDEIYDLIKSQINVLVRKL